MDTINMWADVRLKAIRIQELKKDIAWGNKNKTKWWWDEEQERFHQMSIQQLKEMTKGA